MGGWSDRILYKVAKRDMPIILFLSPDTNDTIIARAVSYTHLTLPTTPYV